MGRQLVKKSLLTLALLTASTAAVANTEYPENPVLRPMTLTDGTIAVGGALAWGEEKDDSRGVLNLDAAYGITDNLTIGFGGIHYRFFERRNNHTGLELTLGAGIRGFQESKVNGDAFALGLDLNGKYVFNKDTAMLFSAGYVKWEEEKLEDKDEFRYSVGVQRNLTKDWTFTARYTYRDLNDFEQNDAHGVNLGLNYAYSKSTDIGVFAGYSSFDAQKNGYDLDNSFDRLAGVYVTYRF